MKSVAIEIIPDAEVGGYTARVPDIPAYGEGDTVEEAVADLREALIGYIETFGLEDAQLRKTTPTQILKADWDLSDLKRSA